MGSLGRAKRDPSGGVLCIAKLNSVYGLDCIPAPLIRRLIIWFRPYGDSLFSNAKKVSKNAVPHHPGLAALDLPHSIIAPRARREGPSLAHRGSRGIHAAQPSTQRFRSAS